MEIPDRMTRRHWGLTTIAQPQPRNSRLLERMLLTLLVAILWLLLSGVEAALAESAKPIRTTLQNGDRLAIATNLDLRAKDKSGEGERRTGSETEAERDPDREAESEAEVETEVEREAETEIEIEQEGIETEGGSKLQGTKALSPKRGDLAVPPKVLAPREVIPVDMGELGQLQRTPAERFLNSVWLLLIALGIGAGYLGFAVIRRLIRNRQGQISDS